MLGFSMDRRWLYEAFILIGVLSLLAGTTSVHAGEPCRLELAKAALEPFEQDGRYGYRRASGEVVIEPLYDHVMAFSADGIAAVVDTKGWAYIDHTGKLLLRPHVVDNGPDYFRDGLARFVADGKVGFMDTQARIVIAAAYAYAEPFDKGYALICGDCRAERDGEHTRMVGKRWGAIDASGGEVVAAAVTRNEALKTVQALRQQE